jgi:hypothetical protein
MINPLITAKHSNQADALAAFSGADIHGYRLPVRLFRMPRRLSAGTFSPSAFPTHDRHWAKTTSAFSLRRRPDERRDQFGRIR